jgi:hypothetical protein
MMSVGYYDPATQYYYLPCATRLNSQGNVEVLSDANVCPGMIFDSANGWNIVGEYLAYHHEAGGLLFPCLTEAGVIPVAVGTPMMFSPKISQVISGVVLDEPFVKTADKLLRINYKFSLI